MRTSSPIDALLPKTRQAVLSVTMMQPERWWYLRDLAKHLGIQPSSLQRELSALVKAGILRRRKDGNRVYFQADPECPFQRELQGLLAKTSGLVDVLRDLLRRFSRKMEFAFVYGSVARSEERSGSDIDLLVVGDVTLKGLSPALSRAEDRLARPVNVSVYTSREFARKIREENHFLRNVLDKEKLFIIGNERELAKASR